MGLKLMIYDKKNLNFSGECKENLEFYLKQDLIDCLASNRINEQFNMNVNEDRLQNVSSILREGYNYKVQVLDFRTKSSLAYHWYKLKDI
uniref:Uncharacterized protein n=1 Tax=Rhizophagus irregularis (strain DAOM 181602 / DAOM 197198 / MUCL 43194) TaxID=747089 RepID=U9TP02_RHIID